MTTKVKLAKPGRPISAFAFGRCVACTIFDAKTLKVLAGTSAAGTSHGATAPASSSSYVPSSGAGNLKSHIKTHHAALNETIWGEPPKTGQGSIAQFLSGRYAFPHLPIFKF